MLLERGDAQRAIVDLTRAIDLGASGAYVYALRAKAGFQAGDYEGVLDALTDDPVPWKALTEYANRATVMVQAGADLREALDRDARLALSVLAGRDVDLSISDGELLRLRETLHWLAHREPGDLDDIVAGVGRAMGLVDRWERLAQLLTLEPAVGVRAADAEEGADVAHAALLDLILMTAAEVGDQPAADDLIDDLRQRTERSRATFAGGEEFERDVVALVDRLAPRSAGPTAG